ncbi:MAG: helix-turn-helix domain-containing protein [Oscillospiraceae bacterium]|nr:helix-turn-helix domain-containing protein [Oscillospiraceae bacterium]
MDYKNFALSYYNNSTEDFHIQKVKNATEAKKPHTHEYFQIYYVAKGCLSHYIDDKSSDLHQGDMFIIPPGVVHRISSKPGTEFYSFSFMPDFLGETNRHNKLTAIFLRNLLTKKNILTKVKVNPEDIFYIESIMERILHEFTGKKIGFNEVIHSCTVLLVAVLARNYFEENSLPQHFDNSKQFVLHCIEYIKNNFTEPITLEEISKRSAMSKNSFCKLFCELTGHSFNSYLNMCRIKKATEYIKDGYKITAIYGLCGYSDFSTFYRNFKKIMGVSPNEFKKTLKNS